MISPDFNIEFGEIKSGKERVMARLLFRIAAQ